MRLRSNFYKTKAWGQHCERNKYQKGPVKGNLPPEVFKGTAITFLSAGLGSGNRYSSQLNSEQWLWEKHIREMCFS